MNLTFITGNQNKVLETEKILELTLNSKKLDIPEIQSLGLKEVVTHKAKIAYESLGLPVLVEDTSLVINVLNGLPGPFIKFFYESLGNEKICRLIDNFSDRSAIAKAAFAICDENGVKVYEGEIEGSISFLPKGLNGFGWDPIFIPKGSEKTYAEMELEEKNKHSFRALALLKLRSNLETIKN